MRLGHQFNKLSFLLISAVFALVYADLFAQRNNPQPDRIARNIRVENLAQQARQKKILAENWAQQYGLQVRRFDGYRYFEIMELRNGRPVYNITHNVNAAISTGANLVRDTSPYYADGSGFIVGIWDAGAVLSTHQEFTGRVAVKDGSASNYHSTHVGGTIGASGVVSSAKGMAPAVDIDSYNWTSEISEMTNAAASYPEEPGKIYVSNHSYGHIAGWVYTNWSGVYGYHWNQSADWNEENSVEPYFGQYDSTAHEYDQIAYDNPYYLIFKSSGNDRNDNPAVGETIYYSNNHGVAWKSMPYSTSNAPLGDGIYKNGYDTITHRGVGKNVMTIGAVNDAVTGGVRDISKATMADFSSWGPADDGRIKPDIVANGTSLYSTDNGNNSDYTTLSGTSMSTPDAAGSAMLLIDYYSQQHPGDAMRSSTLKGLIINTADDLGNPGPDYNFGWGLMNTQQAAVLITQDRIREGLLSIANSNDIYELNYAGGGGIRATLCWTDPPAGALSTHDDPSPRLINDLDLRIIGPNDTVVYYPYVLDPANPSIAATTGDNILDNVEQVWIALPDETGIYKIQVSYKGTLTDNQQHYSLIFSAPLGPAPPVANNINVAAVPDLPLSIILEGSDDGFPDPPGALEYIIMTLPEYGSISDPCSSLISQVPYTLINNGREVLYTALPCYSGADGFEYKVNDGGILPDGGDSDTAIVSIEVGTEPVIIYEADFEQGLPEGWSIIDGFSDGETWTSDNPGNRISPNGNWTGGFMIVDSDWADYVDMNELLITGNIDCSNLQNVTLSFSHDFIYYDFGEDEIGDVDVRVNSGPWQNFARYEGEDFEGLVELDISSIADGEPNVQICWHYYNAYWEWWWGIDNVHITAQPVNQAITGDFIPDCQVDAIDFAAFASAWLTEPNDFEWQPRFDISEPNDNIIDFFDLKILTDNWLVTMP